MADCKRCDECGFVEVVTDHSPDGEPELPALWECRELRDPYRYVDLCPTCVARIGPEIPRHVPASDGPFGSFEGALKHRYDGVDWIYPRLLTWEDLDIDAACFVRDVKLTTPKAEEWPSPPS